MTVGGGLASRRLGSPSLFGDIMKQEALVYETVFYCRQLLLLTGQVGMVFGLNVALVRSTIWNSHAKREPIPSAGLIIAHVQ